MWSYLLDLSMPTLPICEKRWLQSRPFVMGTWGSPLLELSLGLSRDSFPQELREKPLPNWEMVRRSNENNALEVFIACLACRRGHDEGGLSGVLWA